MAVSGATADRLVSQPYSVTITDNLDTVQFSTGSMSTFDLGAVGKLDVTPLGTTLSNGVAGSTVSGTIMGRFTLRDVTKVWNSATGGLWAVGTSWAQGYSPLTYQNAVFNLNATYAAGFSADATAKRVDIAAGAVTFNLASRSLTLSDRVNIDGGGGTSLTIDGGTLTTGNAHRIAVGNASSGSLTVRNGATVNTPHLILGDDAAAAHGEAHVTGAGTVVNVTSDLGIGDSGSGTFTISDRATVSVTDETWMAAAVGETGTLTVGSATGTAKLKTGSLYVGGWSGGSFGNATVNINPGGMVESTGVTRVWNGGTRQINLAGGTLKTGSLDLADDASRLNWTGGTFELAGGTASVGALGVPVGGMLRGTGTIDGNVTNLGAISPGNSPGTLTIDGNYTELDGFGSIVAFELAGTGAGEFDRIVVTGTAHFEGTILIALSGAFVPEWGDSFDLMDFASATGTPTFETLTNAPLPAGLSWDTSTFLTDGVVSVVPEPTSVAAGALAAAALLLRRRGRRV